METGQKGINLIKKYEGLALKAYLCPANVLTIGYGHTGKDVIPDMQINEVTAEQILKKDLEKFEKAVDRLVTSKINQNQFDALVSFTFNLGEGNLKSSTLLKKINANPSDKSIGAEFLKWNKGGGRVLSGLTKRRASEVDLYFKPIN